ncbi:MAG: isoprenyl transferase [Chakrabartia godavariana]
MSAATAPAAAAGQGGNVPRHVAIIMDGNGRWAKRRLLPRIAGHRKGIEAAKAVVRAAGDLGIEVLTLYAFSTENWRRPADEVSDLMGLLRRFIIDDLDELAANGVRLRIIGDYQALKPDLVQLIDDAMARTASNTKTTLVIALNYGSQAEIARAARRLAEKVADGTMAVEDITPGTFEGELYTKDVAPPDLVIRTSGEQRLSNFLLWQAAYAELMFVDTLWPDFGKADLAAAIRDFGERERRFGGV